jgi:hypothetical protein
MTFRKAKSKGFNKLYATIKIENQNAVTFYQNLGFKPIHSIVHHHAIDEGENKRIHLEKII